MPLFDQGQLGSAVQALLSRRQQIAAQIEAASQAHAPGLAQTLPAGQPMTEAGAPTAQAMQPVMSQAQFSGYGMTSPKPQMTPQQLQQLAALLQQRQGQP